MLPFSRAAFLFAAICCGSALGPVSAQNDRDGEEEVAEIETLLILGIADRWSTGASVSTLSGEEFSRTTFAHPYELFAAMPGTWISRGSGQEHLTAIRSPVLTGPGACGAFLILEDGIPIRPAGFCNVNNLFESTLELAGDVELVRGPAAAGFGGNALHGAINIRSLPATERGSGTVRLELGSWGYRTAKAQWRQGEDDGGLQIGFFASGDDGYRDESGYDLGKLKLRYSFRGNDDIRSALYVDVIDLRQETAGFIEGLDAYRAADAVRRANLNPEAYRDASAGRVNYQAQYGDGKNHSRLRLWARSNDMAFLMHFLPCTPTERNNHTSFGASWDSTGRQTSAKTLWLLESEHDWGVHAELANIHLDQYQQKAHTDCGIGFSPQRFPQGAHYDYDVASQNLALRASGRYGVALLEPRLLWDLRLEHLNYDYSNNLSSGIVENSVEACGARCRYSRPPSGDDSFTMLAARVATAFEYETWKWHLALASGYRPPQVGELYRLQQGQTTADLNPEQLVQLEWGGQWDNKNSQLDWSIYLANKTNHIYRDSDRTIFPNGATDHLGIELTWQFWPADAHELVLTATLAQHRYDFNASTISSGTITAGDEVDTAPGELLSANWNWQINAQNHLQLEWLYTGAYYTDAANEHSYDGHQLLGLRFSSHPLPRLKLSARVHNLADTAYADRADYTIFTDERYFPGLPRTFYLGAQWSFE